MIRKTFVAVPLVLVLAGCVATATPPGQTEEGLNERLLSLVAPGQDTSSVRIESDGCYWYRYVGPVEVTYLPLVTRDGRMICTRPQ